MPQAKLVVQNAQGGLHNGVDVGRDLLRFSVAREFEQSLDDGFTPLGFLDDDVQAFFKGTPLRNLFAHVGTVKQDTGQGVVYLMGNPGRHATQ